MTSLIMTSLRMLVVRLVYTCTRHPVHLLHHPKVICDDVLYSHRLKAHVVPAGASARRGKARVSYVAR